MGTDMNSNPYTARFDLILSDPMNRLIPSVPDAGSCTDGIITMHNGLKVYDQSYYGQFSDILKLNRGIHEPSEEYVFGQIIEQYRGKRPVMVEIGSYWAFYSMWMKQVAPDCTNYCIDIDIDNLKTGYEHFELNGMAGVFLHGNDLDGIPPHIDLLHCDIQGHEADLIRNEGARFVTAGIDYLFLSTHSMDLPRPSY